MTVSFHHHLRNGDYVLNMVMDEIAEMGIGDLTRERQLAVRLRMRRWRSISETAWLRRDRKPDYMSVGLGRLISEGHHGRAGGVPHPRRPPAATSPPASTPIDVAFIAAPAADPMGNCTGKLGPSACGSAGLCLSRRACTPDKVVVDHRQSGALSPCTAGPSPRPMWITSSRVDAIGDPAGHRLRHHQDHPRPRGPRHGRVRRARSSAHSGLLKDGFSFQTGAGGASLAAAKFLKDVMARENRSMAASACGGITGYLVDMLERGLLSNR